MDRYASYRQDWGDYYEKGGLVLADRYTTSNAVHQGSKLHGKERTDFFDWLFDYEYRLLELPKPDLVIYLDVPVDQTERNMPDGKFRPVLLRIFMSGMTAISEPAGWQPERRRNALTGRELPAQKMVPCAPLMKFMRMFTVP